MKGKFLTGVVRGTWLTWWPFAMSFKSARLKSDSAITVDFCPVEDSSTSRCIVVLSSLGGGGVVSVSKSLTWD